MRRRQGSTPSWPRATRSCGWHSRTGTISDRSSSAGSLPPPPQNDRRLAAARGKLRDRLKVATTLGYGPRFLHSTGQLHKGGPPIGHFLQITERPDQDVPIPGMPYAFGQLEAAQAEGDLRALRARGRPAVRIDGLGLLER